MAIRNIPTIRTVIAGDDISSKDISETFTLAEKLEAQYILDADHAPVVLDESFIDNLKTIIFSSTGTYTITFTMLDANVVPFEVSGVFKFNPTAAFRALVDNISISTASTANITVNVSAYGESV